MARPRNLVFLIAFGGLTGAATAQPAHPDARAPALAVDSDLKPLVTLITWPGDRPRGGV